MPPKRTSTSGSSSSGSSSDSSSGSGSSSSGTSSSSSDGDDSSSDDSDSSTASKVSKLNTRSRSSTSSTSSSSLAEPTVRKENAKNTKKSKKPGAFTRNRSSVSSASDSDKGKQKKRNTSTSKSTAVFSKSKSSSSYKIPPQQQHISQQRKVAPKKSATAKPVAKPTALAKKPGLSENDSDSDFGDFQLSKFSAKKAKKQASSLASTASSSSAGNTPNPLATPTTVHGLGGPPQTNSSSMPATKTGSQKASNKSTAGQLKNKTIFSESDDEVKITNKKLPTNNSPSPPKLTPHKKSQVKIDFKTKASSVVKPASTTKKKSFPGIEASKKTTQKALMVSFPSSSSESALSCSSDSSDSEVKFKTSRKSTSKKSTKSSAESTKKSSSQGIKDKNVSLPGYQESSDSESDKRARPTTRQTRGGVLRRSKHVTGRSDPVGDSESETDAGITTETKTLCSQKRKMSSGHSNLNGGTHELPPVRKILDGHLSIETRKCPVPGCDSTGHLGGRLERHFLQDACPVYHNINRRDCKDFRQELNKRVAIRKKALQSLATKSPLLSPTSEQKKHAQRVKDSRSTHKLSELPSVDNEEQSEDREIDLKPFASDWDIRLFREAQAFASEDFENSLKGLPDTKTTKYLEMGKFEMEVWYQSPFPEDFTCLPKIYVCEFCLKYMKSATTLRRHAAKCVWKHPPGDEIYRKDKISVFEICGKRYKQYCQSLCLLAKFFLDHKTLYFDVEPFLFYVMTTADSEGCHLVGYFSKEKNSFQNYNVSCILTLPCYQRQGYGRLLIDFSYLLSRVENKIGSPEKPLSDLGLITYRAYWKDVIMGYLCNFPDREISIKNLSEEMGINSYDIVSTLQYLGMIKYWKGQHVILKKEDLINAYMRKQQNKPKTRQIHPSCLKWKPYEPTAKERKHAEKIKKSQEERQKKR